MKKAVILVFLGMAVVAAIFFLTCKQDQRIIKKKLNLLADTVSRSPDQDELTSLAKAGRLKGLFTPDCLIELGEPIPRIDDRETLMAMYYNFQRAIPRIEVTFRDIAVTIERPPLAAKTVMTATAVSPDSDGGGRRTDAREIEMEWKKIDRTWKIFKVSEVKTLY